MDSLLSIIIPTLNDTTILSRTLSKLEPHAASREIIVVDAGDAKATQQALSAFNLKYIRSRTGRGYQMNCGASAASGNVFLFLHADTILPPQFEDSITQALEDTNVVGGAFSLAFDMPSWGLKVIAAGANLRSRYIGLPYGDQALFVRRSVYHRMQGFKDLPLLEDVDFVRRLAKEGKLRLLKQEVISSARRWRAQGVIRTTLLNQIIMVGYYCGISPNELSRMYHSAGSRP